MSNGSLERISSLKKRSVIFCWWTLGPQKHDNEITEHPSNCLHKRMSVHR